MNAYKFAAYPSNSSVASAVTLLVSAWFLVASGAILADASSPNARADHAQAGQATRYAQARDAAPATAGIAPQARLTITVEARRSANL